MAGKTHIVSVFINSGASANFMKNALVTQLPKPILASALDGRLLCSVTHRTVPVNLVMSGNHQETLSFHLINALSIPSLNFTTLT